MSSFTVTSTCARFGLRATLVTLPTTTSLKRTSVWAASMPSAVRKVIVMVGPVCITVRTISTAPTTSAAIGTSHASDRFTRLRRTTVASG